jgi:hypothetical protein
LKIAKFVGGLTDPIDEIGEEIGDTLDYLTIQNVDLSVVQTILIYMRVLITAYTGDDDVLLSPELVHKKTNLNKDF